MPRRRAPFLGIFAIAPLAALLHCGDTSFGTNDVADAAGDDGGDARDSAPVSDGSVSSDASTGFDDGSIGPGGSSPCVGAEHWFCDDFDRSSPLTAPHYWQTEMLTTDSARSTTGSMTIEPPGGGAAPSGLNAVVVSAYSTSSNALVEQANVAYQTPLVASGLTCHFSMRIASRADARATLATIGLITADGRNFHLLLESTTTGAQARGYGVVSDAGAAVSTSPTKVGSLSDSAWHAIQLSAITGASAQLAVSVDGVVFAVPAPSEFAAFTKTSSVSLELGLAVDDGPKTQSVVDYDSYSCDVL